MGSDGVVWWRAWQSGRHTIRLGERPDGRWLAWHSRGDRTVDCWDERAACDQIQRWMGRAAWTELAGAEAA